METKEEYDIFEDLVKPTIDLVKNIAGALPIIVEDEELIERLINRKRSKRSISSRPITRSRK